MKREGGIGLVGGEELVLVSGVGLGGGPRCRVFDGAIDHFEIAGSVMYDKAVRLGEVNGARAGRELNTEAGEIICGGLVHGNFKAVCGFVLLGDEFFRVHRGRHDGYGVRIDLQFLTAQFGDVFESVTEGDVFEGESES